MRSGDPVGNTTKSYLNNSGDVASASLRTTRNNVSEHDVSVDFRSRPQVEKLAYFKHDTGHLNLGFVDLDG